MNFAKTNIYLIGPMGSGKSSVGMHLAKLAGLNFYDSDQEIEKRTGVSIAWIFEVESEAGFRIRESKIIHELCEQQGLVLSTGGGAILDTNTRHLLSATGKVIYLKVSSEQQFSRTSLRKGIRPLATGSNAEQLQQLNLEREPLYEEIADHIYLTDHFNPRQLAAKILYDLRASN